MDIAELVLTEATLTNGDSLSIPPRDAIAAAA